MESNEPTVKVSTFLGLRNTDRDARLPSGALTGAQNIDIDDSGGIDLRQGYSSMPGLGVVTAAYSTEDEEDLYVVDDGVLKRILSMSPLVTQDLGGVGDGEIHWTEAGNRVYFAGSGSAGVIDGGQLMPLGIETPAAPGAIIVTGDLPAGRYLSALVYRDEFGREGGCSAVVETELTADGGIQYHFDVPAGMTGLLYVSMINGTQLFRLTETISSSWIWTAGGPSSVMLPEEQVGSFPVPDGIEFVAHHESRIWAAHVIGGTSFIYRSRPFWHFLFDLTDYIAVPGEIRMLVALDQGVIIGTDDAIYAHAEDSGLNILADYGVVPGQPALIDGRTYFWTKRGLCSALPFQNHTDETFSVPHGTRAAVGLNESGGRKMVIVATDTSGIANNPYYL